jgi:hypothetical protein
MGNTSLVCMQNVSVALPFIRRLRPSLTCVVSGWKGIRDRGGDGGSVISFTGIYGRIFVQYRCGEM